jgi:clan AA aspartic protease
MIRGRLSEYREAVVRIVLVDAEGSEYDCEAIIDTGYDGHVTLPPSAVAELELPWIRSSTALLADGSETLFDVHEATVEWDGEFRRISVDVADTSPLLGMAMLWGFKLSLSAIEGGEVIIEAVA